MTEYWWRSAACRGAENAVEVFFGSATLEAMRYCSGCPVRAECLAEAMDDLEYGQGIRGGTTYPQRVEMAGGKLVIAGQRRRLRNGVY